MKKNRKGEKRKQREIYKSEEAELTKRTFKKEKNIFFQINQSFIGRLLKINTEVKKY